MASGQALAYIISVNWEGKPESATPGLGDVFAKPFYVGPLILAALIWIVSLFITFVRWWLLVRGKGCTSACITRYVSDWSATSSTPFCRIRRWGHFEGGAIARDQTRRTVAVATVIIDRIIGLWRWRGWSHFWAASRVTENPYLINNEALKTIVRATVGIVVRSAVAWSLLGLQTEERASRIATRLSRIPKIGHSVGEIWRACSLYRRQSTVVGIALAMTLVGAHRLGGDLLPVRVGVPGY